MDEYPGSIPFQHVQPLMTKSLYALLLLLLVAACSTRKGQQEQVTAIDSTNSGLSESDRTTWADLGYYKTAGDSVIIPPFEVEVELTVRANTLIRADQETIIVSAFLTGIPKDTTLEDYQREGEIGILNHDVELTDTRIALFKNLKFSRKVYDSLADKDIRLLLNVYSGRKSAPDNLLNCDIFSGKLSTILNKRPTLFCSLIEGDER